MEYFLVCSNFAFWVYVCGQTVFDGCGVQIVCRDKVCRLGDGK